VPNTSSSGAPGATQEQINAEISQVARDYAAASQPETQPRLDYPAYRSSIARHPRSKPYRVAPELIELRAPVFGHQDVDPLESDLTIQHAGAPIGERIVVTGRVLDSDGRPVAGQLVEVWQANAAGRYIHIRDQHNAPLDPNFTGVGRCLTGPDGSYQFTTIKPGPYPWRNHHNAWRPAHIHFSVFGRAFTQRLITQMYFPGDPLFDFDPIFQAVVDRRTRERLVAVYDHDVSAHERHTGYRWDIVLSETPMGDA
jgi:protocatechuate 3,4-dioxygenase beta subunit